MGSISMDKQERKSKKKVEEYYATFLMDVPLLKIFMLRDLDRVNPVFWPVFFAFIFIIVGVILSSFIYFFNIFAWVGGFILFLYLILAIVFLWGGLK